MHYMDLLLHVYICKTMKSFVPRLKLIPGNKEYSQKKIMLGTAEWDCPPAMSEQNAGLCLW